MSSITYDFSDRVVLVTGATGGMGRAISHAMVDAGARLAVADLDPANGAELVADLGGGDSIVNIVSTNSFRPQHDQPADTASKHAVLGLTRSAALDDARHGIRVNAICPGAIDTPMLHAAIERRGRSGDDVAGRLRPLGRFGRPDEIAAAALRLGSDSSSFTTGHALAVDGGMLGS